MTNREQDVSIVSLTPQVILQPLPWQAPAIPTELETTKKALKTALDEMNRMQDEIDTLRNAGDQLVEWMRFFHQSDRCYSKTLSECVCGLDKVVKEWDAVYDD